MRRSLTATLSLACLMSFDVATAGAASPPKHQVSTGFCRATADEITKSLKLIAFISFQDRVTDSGSGAVESSAQITSDLEQINDNLIQLKGHNCSRYPYPISPSIFEIAAGICVSTWMHERMLAAKERLRAQIALKPGDPPLQVREVRVNDLPECALDTWKPVFGG